MQYKTFMIYNEFYQDSKYNMLDSLKSYDATWNAEAFDGCSPNNIKDFEDCYKLPNTDRYKNFVKESKHLSKKCCFYSHYSLWDYCAKNLDFIVIVENDVEAVQSFPIKEIKNFVTNHHESFGIQITTESMTLFTSKNKKHNKKFYKYSSGIHPIYHKNSLGKHYLMGATGYILNNSACKYLIDNCKTYGWTQNDLLFNAEDDFDLYFIKPSIAFYNVKKEKNTSSRNNE